MRPCTSALAKVTAMATEDTSPFHSPVWSRTASAVPTPYPMRQEEMKSLRPHSRPSLSPMAEATPATASAELASVYTPPRRCDYRRAGHMHAVRAASTNHPPLNARVRQHNTFTPVGRGASTASAWRTARSGMVLPSLGRPVIAWLWAALVARSLTCSPQDVWGAT